MIEDRKNEQNKQIRIMLNSGKINVFFGTRKRLVDAICNAGYSVTVSGFDKENEHLCNENGVSFAYIPFSRAGMNPFNDLKVIKKYKTIMKKESFDIVHSYTVKPNIYGAIAAKKAGIKQIYPTVNGLGYTFTDDGYMSCKERLVRFITCKLYKRAFKNATKVFFQNIDDANELVMRRVLSREKCVIIPGSGIDLEAFPYCALSERPIQFLMASRLLITKGVREFFEAARIVKQKYPDVECKIAGSLDPNPDGIREEELNLYTRDGIIDYIGYVDMPKALEECSVFVLPSYYREGIPHAILEAMSIGRAVITCDTPGCKETVKDADCDGKGKNGFLVKPRDCQTLADRMIWMIEHPDELREMGKESRQYAEERFDVELVNQIILQTMGII